MVSVLATDQFGLSLWQQTWKRPAHSQLPLGPVDVLAAVRPTKKPQYKSISSLHSLLIHLYSPHPLLHLHFDPMPILALPRAPCIVVMDNAP
jgi:hypothetical protein